MKQKVFLSATAILLSCGAHAQSSLYQEPFVVADFLQHAPEDYLPMAVEWERQSTYPGSEEIYNWDDAISDYLDSDAWPPADFALTSYSFGSSPKIDFSPASLTDFGATMPFLQADASQAPSSAEAEAAAIAEALSNPLSYLWLMFMQNDTITYTGDILDTLGEDDLVNNTLIIQPVLSIQLTEKWKTVLRPVIPINSFKTVGNVNLSTGGVFDPIGVDFTRESGIGDIVLWMALSKQYKPPDIFGFGITTMFNTASEDQLGTGKNSAGPMALAFKVTEKWIYGVVAQHWWSYSGDDTVTINTNLGPVMVDRPDVSLTDVQPVLRYRVSAVTNIGLAPNWRYNHESSQLSLPIGIGADTLIKLGRLPVKIGAELYYYAVSDDAFGPEWQLRLLFVPVLPAPAWARNPLF